MSSIDPVGRRVVDLWTPGYSLTQVPIGKGGLLLSMVKSILRSKSTSGVWSFSPGTVEDRVNQVFWQLRNSFLWRRVNRDIGVVCHPRVICEQSTYLGTNVWSSPDLWQLYLYGVSTRDGSPCDLRSPYYLSLLHSFYPIQISPMVP